RHEPQAAELQLAVRSGLQRTPGTMKKPSNAKVSSSATPQEPAPPGRLNGETLIAAITSMTDDNDHIACVNAWLDPAERRLPPAGLVSALDRGFAALWQRAN